jgi:hypothetical protein
MHPASSFKTIRFKDVDGQNFIMYAQTGIWEPIVNGRYENFCFSDFDIDVNTIFLHSLNRCPHSEFRSAHNLTVFSNNEYNKALSYKL